MKNFSTILRSTLAAVIAVSSAQALAHGDVTPQAVDTSALPQLGEEWKATNPYTGNELAIKISGTSS